MLNKIILFALLAALGIAAAWLADHPGTISLQWLDYRIETSAAFLAACVVIVSLLVWLALHLLSGALRLPQEWQNSRKLARYEQGLSSLTQAFIALSDQSEAEAARHLRKAEQLLPQPTLPRLLNLQLGRVQGDEEAMMRQFKLLEAAPETKPLALKGLMEEARRRGRNEEALKYAEELLALRPRHRQSILDGIALYSLHRRWQEAVLLLNRARRQGILSRSEVNRHLAVIHTEQAEAMLAEHNRISSIAMLTQAVRKDASLTPAAAKLALLLRQTGKDSAAARAIRASWKLEAHPALAEQYRALYESLSPQKRLKKMEALAACNPQAAESQIAVAEAAMEASAWEVARNHLKTALSKRETVRLCQLMAKLERLENPEDEGAGKGWLERAAAAAEDPDWHCNACGHQPEEWYAHCPECRRFDSIRWQYRPYRYSASPQAA